MLKTTKLREVFKMTSSIEYHFFFLAHFVPWKAGEAKDYGKMFVSNKKSTDTPDGVQSVLEVLPEGKGISPSLISSYYLFRLFQFNNRSIRTMS